MDICSDNHAEIVFNSRETRCPCCEANSRINDAIELLNAIPSEIAYTLATDGNPGEVSEFLDAAAGAITEAIDVLEAE